MVKITLPAFFLIPLLASGCGPKQLLPSSAHIKGASGLAVGDIPQPVQQAVVLPSPVASEKNELYSVVVNEVPVRDLLFAIARDARLNVDIHHAISGTISMNAVDQTLPQILDRIARQCGLRCEYHGKTLALLPDTPYVQTYPVDYVNISRDSTSSVNVATKISTTGLAATGDGGSSLGNNSATGISSVANNRFWRTLTENIRSILTGGGGNREADPVIANPENGMVTVRATARQHEVVQEYLAGVISAARRQVLIEATVIEVQLSDHFQQGVDWQILRNSGKGGVNLVHLPQGPHPLPTGASPGGSYPRPLLFPYEGGTPIFGSGNPATFLLNYTSPQSRWGSNIAVTLSLLESFGRVKVLSSPRISVLNNQTALLKVVDNKVYFTVDLDVKQATANSPETRSYTTTINTVPVGFVMSVTPQIDEADTVILNVRPSITRVTGYARDPNPELARAQVSSLVPEIQTREMESIMKIHNSEVAVMGGLMQDTVDEKTDGVPGLSGLPVIGPLFRYRNDVGRKSELVIFLRPLVVKDATLAGDYRHLEAYLPGQDFFIRGREWEGIERTGGADPGRARP